MKHSKIILIGMMGCGKSTIAKNLSKKINLPCYDSDTFFEQEVNISIKEYFKIYGEENFRKKESEILKKLINSNNCIISCGGGIVLKKENREILFDNKNITIYLSATADTIYNRIKNETQRPLLLVDDPLNEIKKILEKRTKLYNLAKYNIKTDNKTIEEITKEIEKIYATNNNFN